MLSPFLRPARTPTLVRWLGSQTIHFSGMNNTIVIVSIIIIIIIIVSFITISVMQINSPSPSRHWARSDTKHCTYARSWFHIVVPRPHDGALTSRLSPSLGRVCRHTCVLVHTAVSDTVKAGHPGRAVRPWCAAQQCVAERTTSGWQCVALSLLLCVKNKRNKVKMKVSLCVWQQHTTRQCLLKSLSHQLGDLTYLPAGTTSELISRQSAGLCLWPWPDGVAGALVWGGVAPFHWFALHSQHNTHCSPSPAPPQA